jgi:hypothetical protein
MLEEFRQQANTGTFFEEDEESSEEAKRPPVKRKFLGMTPAQRLVIALILLMMACIMGTLFLVVTGKVVL